MYIVYKHTNKTNGKVYIGITCQKVEDRWKKGSGYRENAYFYNSIKKYGWDGFLHEIIAENLSKEEAENLEIELIKKYDSTNQEKGYNRDLGGNHQGKHSLETKEKMSKSQKGRTLTEEHRKRLSESHKGQKVKPENIEKLRLRMLGNQYTLGYKASEETKRKMSESQKGKHGRKVICVNDDKIYNSISQAAESYGLNRHQVLNICRGVTQKIYHSDLIFRYYEGG